MFIFWCVFQYQRIVNDYFEHCFDCYRDSKGKTWAPQLPAGKIPDPDQWYGTRQPGDGKRPPDAAVDFSATRSGDIYIFAHEIVISPDLDSPIEPGERAECRKVVPPLPEQQPDRRHSRRGV
jgi:hypothetical protein